jgi:hypothetical protein
MRTVSKSSSARRAVDIEWSRPEPRRRRRDAKRWRDILAIYSTNGRVTDRWPGQRLLTIGEGCAIHEAALAWLNTHDADLSAAVSWVQSKCLNEDDAILAASFAAWQAHAAKRMSRLSRVRATFRPAGPEPNLRAVYWRFLRATEFLTAEVAERQTR